MIIVFEGTPGSGKSYEAIKKIMDNLRLPDRIVYTNIDGTQPGHDDKPREALKTVCKLDDYDISTRLVHLTNREIKEFPKHIKRGSLVVVDEAHNHFNARDWATAENRAVVAWAEEHRHYGYDVLLLTTDAQKIDKQLRSLVEWTYHFKKVGFFGSLVKNKYLVTPFSGDGSGKPLGNPEQRTYNPIVFQCYKSYVAQDIKELKIMKHFNVLKHPVFYALPLAMLFFLYMVSKSSFAKGKFFPEAKSVSQNSARNQSSLSPTLNQQAVASGATTTQESVARNEYQCTGKMEDGDRVFYVFRKRTEGVEEGRQWNLFVNKADDFSAHVGQVVEVPASISRRFF